MLSTTLTWPYYFTVIALAQWSLLHEMSGNHMVRAASVIQLMHIGPANPPLLVDWLEARFKVDWS